MLVVFPISSLNWEYFCCSNVGVINELYFSIIQFSTNWISSKFNFLLKAIIHAIAQSEDSFLLIPSLIHIWALDLLGFGFVNKSLPPHLKTSFELLA